MIRLYLKEWRAAHGLSHQHLAARTELTLTTLARLEHGSMSWTPGHLEKLSEAMNIHPADLLKEPPK